MSRSRCDTVSSSQIRCALVPLCVFAVGPILPELTCKTLAPTATCLRATGTDDPDGTPKFRNLKRQHGKSNALARSSRYHCHDAAVFFRYEKPAEILRPTPRPIPARKRT